MIPCHPIENAGLVYVEIPKAGCTSVKSALSVFKGGPTSDEIHQWFGYTHAPDVGTLQRWLDTRWRDLFRFTVVRDPIARFESFYWGLAEDERGCWGDIDRYIIERAGDDGWEHNIHLYPQTRIIGRDLGLFDHVGRTEDMDATAAVLSGATGQHVRIERLNASTAERKPLSEAALKRLRVLYREDLEVLGYG